MLSADVRRNQPFSFGIRQRCLCVFYCRASGRKMEKFTVSVNIAAESNVTFILTYEELLQRKLGQYEILIRVKPKSLVQQFQVNHQIVNLILPPKSFVNMFTNSVSVFACVETDFDKHL